MLRTHPPTLRHSWLAALVVTTVVTASAASSASAAGLLVADGGFGGVLQIKQHDARVTINNGVAVTEVEQIFVNTENRQVEALYTFPVPKQASVANFSMWINGKEMIGEVVEKERAREIYNSYKQVRRDPGLLEQVDYKTFEMRIFPIAPKAEQRVRITYYQELDYDHDWGTYVYPLATRADKGIDQNVGGRFSLTLNVKSEVPIVELKSPSHADEFVLTRQADDHYWQASMEATGGDLGRDVVLAFHTQRPHSGLDLITSRTGSEDGYFQLTFTAGKELEDSLGGSDYVFLLDVSGSMARDQKLGLSRGSVAAFVDSLDSNDRFELITFNIAANPLFSNLASVDDQSKQRARDFLNSQKARGGTILRPAVEAAYRYRDNDRPLNVVILSDGMTEQTEQRELLDLIKRRPAGTTVFCVGVGNDVNRPLMSQLAHDAGGLAAFISAGDDFERQADAFRRKLTRPAAANVRLAFEGGDVYDVEPLEVSNLYHGQPVRVYGRYRRPGPMTIHLQADILGSPLKQDIALDLPATDEANPEIERMWASYRVERLMEDDRRSGSIGSQQSEIVRLCEGYSMVSEYASFIVLENDAEYARWKIDRRNATRVDRDRNSQEAVRRKLEDLRDKAQASVGPAPAPKKTDSAMQPSFTAPPVNTSPSSPGMQPQAPQASAPPAIDNARPDNRSRDFAVRTSSRRSSGGGGGGGAIDPITAAVAVGMAGIGAAARRRSQRQPRDGERDATS